MRVRKALLIGSTSALAMLAAAAPAFAADEPSQVQEVVITGIRASLQQSIQAKRNADTVIEVITAEDVGKFPDKNVAESLQRAPGVAVVKEFGEGERVSIRGTAPTLNRTLLNGHAIATADWFVLDQLNASRSFNYLMLPSEIVGQVDVYKGSRADIDEGGIGGTVDVHTRNPLDLDKFAMSASAQAVYDEKSKKTDPAASGLLSWHNDDKTLGVLVGLIYQKRTFRRDGIEFLGYTNRTIGAQTNVATPDLIGSTIFNQERVRKGANFGLQYRPNDSTEFNLTGLYSHMDASNFNQNYMAWFSQMFNAGAVVNNPGIHNGTLVSGDFNLQPGANGVVFDAIDRIAHTQTRSIDLEVKHRFSDTLKVSGRVGYTDAVGATDQQPFWETNAPTGFTFDFSQGVPKIHFKDINPATDATPMALGWASNNTFINDDNEFYVFGDAEWDVNAGPFTSIKAGLKYTDHDRDVDVTYGQRRALLPWTGPGATACNGHPCSLADVSGGLTPSDFLSGIAIPGTLTQYIMADKSKIEAFYAGLGKADTYNPAIGATQAPGCVSLLNCNHFGPLESFEVREKTYGGYVVGDFHGEGWRGNVGVRIVHTEEQSNAWKVGVPTGTPGAVNNPFGLIAPITASKDYNDILPSANLTFDVAKDMILRFSASRVMARPDYAQMGAYTSLTPTLLTGSGGNPNINPYRANAFDASWEWYFQKDAILAVDFFYKDLSTFIVQGAFTERQPLENNNPADPRVTNPANHCVLSGTNIYTCDFVVSRPVNVSGGHLQGLEVNYQQPIWNGFGIIANYTLTDSGSDSGVPVPSASRNIYNLTGYYENDRLSARLSYNFREHFFQDYEGGRGGRPLYVADLSSLDASVNVNLMRSVSLTFDAINLTDQKVEEYYDNDPGRPARFYKNGRTFFAGVRFKY
jgi:iron complex outermembrane receptor protein